MLILSKDPHDPWQDHVTIKFGYRDADGNLSIAAPAIMEIAPIGSPAREDPMLKVCIKGEGSGFLQSIMDQLWEMGVRPQDIGTAGHLAATQVHLADMRAIAFAKLEVTKP